MANEIKHAAVVDFESLPAEHGSGRTPLPVGFALRVPGKASRYYAFAHPSGNNCTWEDARSALGHVWASDRPILNHNLHSFDHQVAVRGMQLDPLDWRRQHDTIPMLFLNEPRAPDYKLKNVAHRLLGKAPDERDVLAEWLVANQPIPGKRLTAKYKKISMYVAFTPGDMAGKYAIGDVDRAYEVGLHQYAQLEKRGMLAAYEQERRLSPFLREMEQQGVRVDLERLEADVPRYAEHFERLAGWLRKRLGVSEDFNLDSPEQLGEALVAAGVATEAGLGRTEGGQIQTNKAALASGVTDAQVLGVLRYRGSLETCLTVFMQPWLEVSRASGGLIYTSWHSTRDDRDAGARTGRLSSTPNFQNISKTFKAFFKSHAADRLTELPKLVATAPDEPSRRALEGELRRLKALPAMPFKGLDPLPRVRGYVIPYEKGHVLIDRDYNQQELRIAAHYENGAMLQAYLDDPWLDYHERVRMLIRDATGVLHDRDRVKTTNFQLIYGGGVTKLSETLGIPYDEAKALRAAVLAVVPGLKQLGDDLKLRARDNMPIRTWCEREYFCEPGVWKDGRFWDFAYKLLNLLVQGSASGCTKAALIVYGETKPKHHRLLLNVHDEIVGSVPREEVAQGMEVLRRAMENVRSPSGKAFDLEMKSEGKTGLTLANLTPYDKRGIVLSKAA